MSRLPRRHILINTRCRVAARQVGWGAGAADQKASIDYLLRLHRPDRKAPNGTTGHSRLLGKLLVELAEKLGCAVADLHLDHDPALENREKIKRGGKIIGYRPDELDPDHLAYRPYGTQFAGSHKIKTLVRGDHGQHSDAALARKNKRIAKKMDKAKNQGRNPSKSKRVSRLPKGRQLRSANRWPPKGSQTIQNRRKP